MSNEYLVAKYISSPARMEPRNIGIFIRSGNSWHARFLGETAPGRLDLRRVRSVVEHTTSYEQWVKYWRHLLDSTGPDNLKEALEASSKVNFIVSEGAPLFLAADAAANPDRTLEDLYHLVVTEFPEQRAEESSLAEIVENTIRRFGLNENPHFHDSPSVRCELGHGVVQHVRPSYGFINGREVYFQTVSLNPNRPERAQKDVHNAAWIFEKLGTQRDGRELNALVKVVTPNIPEEQASFSVDESLGVLGALSQVVNVEDGQTIDRVFGSLAA